MSDIAKRLDEMLIDTSDADIPNCIIGDTPEQLEVAILIDGELITVKDIKAKDSRIAELEDFVKSVANAKIEVAEISGRYGGTEDISFISDIYVDRAKELFNKVDTM